MEFNPMNFVHYLKYMGVGMLSVFFIIFIIICATKAIAAITSKLLQKNSEEN